jgi:SMI1 / KNR4 family (SUKH-1)
MTASSEKLFARFQGNPPAPPASIVRCQENLHFRLPPDYARLLQRMNGGEGFIGEQYLQLWPIEEFMKQNTGTYYAQAAPGLLVFGSDGAGEAFAFDTRSQPPPIVMVPFIGMELKTAITIASGFHLFLQVLYRSESLFQLRPPHSQRGRET